MSTLEYLRKKAEQDAMEHKQEDMRQQRQILRETGGAGIGRRFLEGESIPAGGMCVHCSYCGADNLLPKGAAGKYTCYFCREFLSL